MDEINALLSYPPEEILTVLVVVFIAIKFFWSGFEWFCDRMKKVFNIVTRKERSEKEFKDSILGICDKIEAEEKRFTEAIVGVKKSMEELNEKMAELEGKENLTLERMQEDSRAYLIDQHNRYMAQGWVGMFEREHMEIRYMYYKSAGGNSFVDDLMQDVRSLPNSPDKA